MPLKLNGTNSVAAPAYAGDDADTGLQCGTNELKLVTGGSEAVTVNSSGQVGIGTTSPAQTLDIASTAPNIRLTDTVDGHSEIDGNAGSLKFNADKGNEKADSTIAFFVDNSQKALIDHYGNFFVGTTDANLYNNNVSTGSGFSYIAGSELGVARWQNNCAYLNRMGNDGDLIRFLGQGSTEGNINVSGGDVTLAGASLSRWSQLTGGAERTEILRGSVLSNLDEMCEWGEEDNEQLNRMKVSDVEGDVNVAGVFRAWDDDDDTYTNDFYCAMTGDFVIRIAQGTTVARGDLLMSAGDGTAKPQGDDIIRSKTIAKVTSTIVSTTYSDGSYCVPCVLMAC